MDTLYLSWTDDEFRDYIGNRMRQSKITRKQLSAETGYAIQYINDIMSKRPFTSKARRRCVSALEIIEKDMVGDEASIKVSLSVEDMEVLEAAANILNIPISEFVRMAMERSMRKSSGSTEKAVVAAHKCENSRAGDTMAGENDAKE